MTNNNRRGFLKTVSMAGLFAVSNPQNLLASSSNNTKRISLSTNDVILFQGDSITDAGRSRTNTECNSSVGLGSGYAYLTACALLCKYADEKLTLFNRGKGGDKIVQLTDRWDADTVSLKPTILSVLVGVNDFWHMLMGTYTGTIDSYSDGFSKLMQKTRAEFPDIKLIIGEPFAIKGVKVVDEKWYPEFDKYRKAARQVADEYNAVFVPYQSVFDKAIKIAPANHWTKDGVHPTIAGNQLMANALLEVFKG